MLELLPGGLLPETLEGFDCWDRPINIQEHLQVRVHVQLITPPRSVALNKYLLIWLAC